MWNKIKSSLLFVFELLSPLLFMGIIAFAVYACTHRKEKITVTVQEVYVPIGDHYFHRIKCSKYNHNVSITKLNGYRAIEAGYEKCKNCFPDTCHYYFELPEDFEWPDIRTNLEIGIDNISDAIEKLESIIRDPDVDGELYLELAEIKATLQEAVEYLDYVEEKEDDD